MMNLRSNNIWWLIGDRVAAVLGDSLTHFGTISSSCILDNGKKHWEILYNDNFDKEEEVDVIELSKRQDLYNLKVENDIVWQQKQNISNIILYWYIYLSILIFLIIVLLHFFYLFGNWSLFFSLLLVVTLWVPMTMVVSHLLTISQLQKKCFGIIQNQMDRFLLPPFWTRSSKMALSLVPKLSASKCKIKII